MIIDLTPGEIAVISFALGASYDAEAANNDIRTELLTLDIMDKLSAEPVEGEDTEMLNAVIEIASEAPHHCPEHPDSDPVSCGWKNDVLRIRKVLGITGES